MTDAALRWEALAKAFELPGMHRSMGARVTRTETGVSIEASLDERFESIPGRLHGGAVACLLDTAATWALIAQSGNLHTTVDLRTDFLRPAALGDLRAVGEVLASGSSSSRARAALFDSSGRCCAVAIGTFAPLASRASRSS